MSDTTRDPLAEVPRRCPRCRSTYLSVTEIHEEIGQTLHGEVFVVDGAVVIPSEFDFEAGDPTYVGFSCGSCAHEWRSRWPVADEFSAETFRAALSAATETRP